MKVKNQKVRKTENRVQLKKINCFNVNRTYLVKNEELFI